MNAVQHTFASHPCTATKAPGSNDCDEDGYSPLTQAVLDEEELTICSLKGKVNMDAIDQNGQTAATLAVSLGKKNIITLLGKNGANLDARNKLGVSPVTYAALLGKTEMIEHLRANGANISLPDASGQTAYDYALEDGKTPLLKALKKHGGTLSLKQELKEENALASIWSLKGEVSYSWGNRTVTVPLNGSQSDTQMERFKQYVHSFLRTKVAKDSFVLEERRTIQKALEQTTDEKIKRHLSANNPLFVTSIFTLPHLHEIGVVMTNETIMICNRGFGKKEHAIQVYTFKQETDRLACLKQLQTITSGENLDKLLLEQAVLTNDFIDQKPQYKRNCTWTSRESALLALFSLILQKKIPDQIACIQKAKRVYKAFTTYAREMSLKKYLIGSPKPNPELLALIKPKIPTNKHFTSRQKSTLIKLVNKYSKGPTLAVVHQEEKAPL